MAQITLKAGGPKARHVIAIASATLLLLLPIGLRVAFPQEHIALLYALPILVAGQSLATPLAVLVALLALAGHSVDSLIDGSSVWTWLIQGTILLIVAYLSVRTRQEQTELARLAGELQHVHIQQERFVSSLAHDIRGGITVILGYAQLLRRQTHSRPSSEARALSSLEAAARHLSRLAGDFQTLSRIERGVFELQCGRCDLSHLAQQVVEDHQALAGNHRLILSTPREPVLGDWDGDRLYQVLDNLVGNAVKYSPNGGEVRVALDQQDRLVTVSVTDRGIGIRQTDVEHLFEPYNRLGSPGLSDGQGLGLYIAKTIVEAHGGRLQVASQPGQGSTFRVVRPTTPSQEPPYSKNNEPFPLHSQRR
ncbi:MAG TPA: HAMP domain-containing sensor histidine kinase [Chloroflexota bacterium]|nr:HAMP domain-containing sensor histidine kinase [Chloroflexota bacterium]